MKSSPCSPQLEKASAQQRRPNAAQNKFIWKKKRELVESEFILSISETTLFRVRKLREI